MKPLVTVGIPTFDRPLLLARALSAVARQDYPNLEVLVADNASPGEETDHVVERYRDALAQLNYVRHEERVPQLSNFMLLVRRASGRYFMWLADDDEISPNYVSSLVEVLEDDPGAVSAAGRWRVMSSPEHGRVRSASAYAQRTAVARALRFIWRSDDLFIYGLHRTAVLRQATFRGYSWPNRGVVMNWAHVFLLDMVLRGRVVVAQDSTVQHIIHAYTSKDYLIARKPLARTAAYVLRRVNVHVLYWEKCARLLSPWWLPLVVGTSVVALLRQAGADAVAHLGRRS